MYIHDRFFVLFYDLAAQLFFLRRNQEFTIIRISPVMVSMHIHVSFFNFFKLIFT